VAAERRLIAAARRFAAYQRSRDTLDPIDVGRSLEELYAAVDALEAGKP
jgi:hypothetical protein